jgi:mono/diheme cytochrome c family protein
MQPNRHFAAGGKRDIVARSDTGTAARKNADGRAGSPGTVGRQAMRVELRHAAGVLVMGVVAAAAGQAAAETLLERGTYLMNSIVNCGNCHTPQNENGPIPGMELAGGLVIEEEAFTVVSQNITPHETGIGGWTDEELETAIREGIRPDGSLIGPPMPFEVYRGLSDTDVAAIIAYLRQVEPVENETPPNAYDIPLPPAYGPPVDSVPDVDRGDPVAYGEYLAGPAGHCIVCHSGPGPHGGPDIVNALGAGGFSFHGPWGISVASNLTPTGIGHYSDEELKTIITTGVRPDGSHLLPPMPVAGYANMTDEDVDAIIAYLRSLPPK